MDDVALARIAADPRYLQLVARRDRFSWALSASMLAIYLGFLLLVAFAKPLMARPIAGGVTSIGIVLGFGVILTAIGLTWVYVRRAAVDYDPLVEALRADADA